MTYLVNEKCIKCKLMDCVEVCPVDCFYEGKNMLVIKPDECIDCGVCEPECPVDAIVSDTEPGSEKWLEMNTKYSEIWPNINEKKEKDSNQILDFTKKVKNISEDEKKIIIEALWKIIYSDENADVYETNLMRRLSGLLYLDNKVVGDIKEKVKQNL